MDTLIGPYFVEYQQSRLCYYRAGQGPEPLLLFHGFGQSHLAFRNWVPLLEHKYTLYSFDLYFHGQSEWKGSEPLEKTDWRAILSLFFEQEGIHKFSVAGFSLGGKFALAAIEQFPERIQDVLLIAPDGIKTSFWYSLATYPVLFRRFFKTMIYHPSRFQTIVKTLRRFNIVDKGILRFAESQMDTEEKRMRVYNAWVVFRHLHFDLAIMAEKINDHPISITVLLGKYDRVIPIRHIQRFVAKLHRAKLEIANAGHNDLVAKAGTFLSP